MFLSVFIDPKLTRVHTGQVIPQIVSPLQVIAFFLVTHPSWCNKKQIVVAHSSTKEEYRVHANFPKVYQTCWGWLPLYSLLSTLGYYTATIRLLIRSINLVDIFTKPPSPGYFHELVSKLKLFSIHPTWVWWEAVEIQINHSGFRSIVLLYCISIAWITCILYPYKGCCLYIILHSSIQ